MKIALLAIAIAVGLQAVVIFLIVRVLRSLQDQLDATYRFLGEAFGTDPSEEK